MPVATNAQRPAVWIGHIILGATDVKASNDYYVRLGLRPIVMEEGFSVLELRGGTHIVLNKQDEPTPEGTAAQFDLMVEDIDATWKEYSDLGFEPSEIGEVADIHRFFTLKDPSGYTILVNSSHVSEYPV